MVFISPPGNEARNWDPFVWAFSGLRPLHPLWGLPVHLRTSDENWKETIARLIGDAGVVVMDLTELSASIEEEVRMVLPHASQKPAIWLMDHRSTGSTVPSLPVTPCQVVHYRRRWAPLSLSLKLGAFAFVGYAIFFYVLGLPLMVAGRSGVTRILSLVIIGSIGAWLAFGAVLVFRPSINREARQTLRRRLGIAKSQRSDRLLLD